jgi:hypothetical protein
LKKWAFSGRNSQIQQILMHIRVLDSGASFTSSQPQQQIHKSLFYMNIFYAHFLSPVLKPAFHKAFWQFDDSFSTQLSTAFVDNLKTSLQSI